MKRSLWISDCARASSARSPSLCAARSRTRRRKASTSSGSAARSRVTRSSLLSWRNDAHGNHQRESIRHDSNSTEDDLYRAAQSLGDHISRNAPLAVRAAKRSKKGMSAQSSADAMSLAMKLRAPLEDTKDSVEGLRAFAEKREPVFEGR